ncbi:2-keto-3-deoxy-L-rhamnonate aldolase RhmA [Roseimicrobium gellanilyticum]|uniref:2-keto-3-deoxy-L-rhamnonate aldolase RhmA n=1 Tax=Roseimicrobium gellanilyticum TaxID=748857 RepID=A0A366H2G3_9BACT|nr:aldolase/citrate lyase family protein [Roseimicrobium gellanilyticum]RBP36092.1 2-keto-3-deoxy-L-rhamnonate aldolase RhmA [Roseimicrobium gellanilyticum]
MPPLQEPRVATPPFTLTLLTKDTAWAAAADAAGVTRVGVDIERMGKIQRQGFVPDARISDHTLADLIPIAKVLHHARAFVRINPLHSTTREEVERALQAGARSLMLPQFRNASEVREFVGMVAGRAETLLLLETKECLEDLDAIFAIAEVDEVMVGLNDLSLALGMRHPMQLVASPTLDDIAARARKAGRAFGFGGVASPDVSESVPVPPDLVLARHAALGSHSAWIARSFHKRLTPNTFGDAVRRLQSRLNFWFTRSKEHVEDAGRELREHLHHLYLHESSRS